MSEELGPLWPVTYREERENAIFVWTKIIVVKMWVPRYGTIAQCFKHKGTFILMYITIQHHFHRLGKIIYQNLLGPNLCTNYQNALFKSEKNFLGYYRHTQWVN